MRLIFFLSIIVSIISLFITQSFAVFSFHLFFLLAGLIATHYIKEKQIKIDYSSYIFVLFYLIYTAFALSVYTYRESYELEFVHASDQIGFYDQSEQLGALNNFYDLVTKCFAMVLVNWNGGSALIFGSGAFFAKHYLDGNHIIIHLYSIAFASGLTIVFLYKTLTKYFDSVISKKYAIVYGLLSYLFYYSGFMLRDVFIALFYMLAIYLIHNEKLSIRTVIKLAIIALIVYSFRNENGLFAFIFILFYIWKSKLTVLKLVSVTVLILLLISILPLIQSTYIQTTQDIIQYEEYRTLRIDDAESASLIKSVSELPPIIKEVFEVGFNLINPFPFWSVFKGRTGDIIFTNYSIAGIFWYYVNGFIFLAILFYRKRIIINKWLVYLFLLAYLFIFLNISEIQVRRIFYIYPIIYIFFLVIFSQIKNKRLINRSLIFFHFMLLIAYVLVKF